jgi:large subunit ribosomal protein L21
MFAVIKTGGKHYTVAEDQTLRLGKLGAKPGEIVTFPVTIIGGESPAFGKPTVAGALVAAEVVAHTRGDKIVVFKKRRRKNSRRKRGHRQDFTLVRITEILTDGKQPSKTAKPRAPKAKRPQAEASLPGETTAAAAKGEAKPRAKSAKQPRAKK